MKRLGSTARRCRYTPADFRRSHMNRRLALVAATLVLAAPVRALDAPPSSRADWLRDARLGVFIHLLPASADDLAKLDDFDVEALAAQLERRGRPVFRADARAELRLLQCAERSLRPPHRLPPRRALLAPRPAPGAPPRAAAEGHPPDALPALPDAERGRARAEGLRPAAGTEGPADRRRASPGSGRRSSTSGRRATATRSPGGGSTAATRAFASTRTSPASTPTRSSEAIPRPSSPSTPA